MSAAQIAMPMGWALRAFRGELTGKYIAEVTTPDGDTRIVVDATEEGRLAEIRSIVRGWEAAQRIAAAACALIGGGQP